MSKLNRREFIKFVGGSAAALAIGMDLPKKTRAAQQEDGTTTLPVPDKDCEIFYPHKYDEKDEKVLREIQVKIDRVNNWGEVDVFDLIRGHMDGTPKVSWNPMEHNFKITMENMMNQAKVFVPNIPLFNDREYAKKKKYGDLIAWPLNITHEIWPSMPKTTDLGEAMMVSGLNSGSIFYKPMYDGDTMFCVYDELHCVDITPLAGSYYRTFAIFGTAKTYNQRGELVAEGAGAVKESYRRRKDPEKRNKERSWETPDWLARKAHQYTDKDWEYIINIWKNEKKRDGVLYWDEVKIGDEPAPNAVGPVLTEKSVGMSYGFPPWILEIKKNMLDSKAREAMAKTEQGIYVPSVKLAEQNSIFRSGKRDSQQNAVCPKCATGMLYNWMGEEGWLQSMGWEIMASPIPDSRFPDSVIPPIPNELRPALFIKYPYLDNVPSMKGKRPSWHCLTQDIIISKAYVIDKYKKGIEYFVDLAWWSETVDGIVVEHGFATVKLPKKSYS